MSMLESVFWDVEDYAGRIGDTLKEAAGLAVAVVVTFPKTAFITLAVALAASTIWALSGGPAPTTPQEIAQHAKPGGSVYWVMQEQGTYQTGILPTFGGNKKQEANFDAAVRFCNAHQGFTGCDKVIKAADRPTFGY